MNKLLRNNNVEKIKPDENKDISDSYFNGAIVFKTKVVWWPNVVMFIAWHIIFIYGWCIVIHKLVYLNEWSFFMYAIVLGELSAEGVSLGAHRLWSHRSFKAVMPLRIVLMILQTIAGQTSIYAWVRDHRTHHKFADTDGDPHNSSRGFFFSHMGWLMMRRHPESIKGGKTIDMSDMEKDPVVMFQYRNMYWMYILWAIIIPTIIGYRYFNLTIMESIIIIYFTRYLTSLHIVWCVNSVAHFFGSKPYDKNIRACDSYFVSYICNGEGWHNYHHVFPWDYKAAESFWKLNGTANAIKLLEFLGLAYDLKEATPEMVKNRMKKSGDSTYRSNDKLELSEKELEDLKMEPEKYDY